MPKKSISCVVAWAIAGTITSVGFLALILFLCQPVTHDNIEHYSQTPRLSKHRPKINFDPSSEPKIEREDQYGLVADLIELSKISGINVAMEQALKLPIEEKENVVYYLLMSQIKDHPVMVSNWVLESGLPENKTEIILNQLVKSWVPHDSYLNWIETKLSGDRLLNIKGQILREIAGKAPSDALLQVSSMPAGTHRTRFMAMIVSGWADSDLTAAKNYVLQNLIGDEFDSAMEELFPKWIDKDIASAKIYLMESSNPIMKKFVPMVVAESLDKDPMKAINWALDLPASLREEGVRSGIFRWVDMAPDSAVDYVEGLDGESKILASRALGAAWSDTDPEAAADWASRQSNDLLTQELTKEVLYRWSRTSPQSAIEWVLEMPESKTKQEATVFLDKIAYSDNGRIPPGYEDYAMRFFNDRRFTPQKRFCGQCSNFH